MPCIKAFTIKDKASSPVLVTGATGYVAGVLVQKLLKEGLTVHATVRGDPNQQKERLQYLQKAADDSPGGKIVFFQANLMEEGSFEESMKGCKVVFHTASPFFVNRPDCDPQKDLVDPAVQGTANVLNTATKTPSVQRVVLTSSNAAVYCDAADLVDKKPPSPAFNEKDWNTVATLDYQPYYYSKTLAEKKAWEISKTQNQWKLIVVNPCLIMGPGLRYHEGSESFSIMHSLGAGSWKKMGVPPLGFGVVDVRDVADAHVAAAFLPNLESGRHLLSGGDTSLPEMGSLLASAFPEYPVGKQALAVPNLLVWLFAPYVGGGLSRKYVSRNFGYPVRIDNTQSKAALAMQYRPLQETLSDMFQQMIDSGAVQKTAAAAKN